MTDTAYQPVTIRDDTPLRITTGIMSWTPDGHALCGEMPDMPGLYHCAGFCGHGVDGLAAGVDIDRIMVATFDPPRRQWALPMRSRRSSHRL